jgi:hypothetical protein
VASEQLVAVPIAQAMTIAVARRNVAVMRVPPFSRRP